MLKNKMVFIIILLSLSFSSTLVLSKNKVCRQTEKQIAGWVERVQIKALGLNIRAKLDTGARNSSLNALNIREYTKKGKRYVKFDIIDFNGKVKTFHKRVIRRAKIKKKGDFAENRIVIKLNICIGSVCKIAQVNLTDRKNFIYPLLIGRTFLKKSFIVDPSLTFIIKSNSKRESKR
jgi:hypothetical protein